MLQIKSRYSDSFENFCLSLDNNVELIKATHNGSQLPSYVTRIKQILLREYSEGVKNIKSNKREDIELFRKIAQDFGNKLANIQLEFQRVGLELEILNGAREALSEKYSEVSETIKRLDKIEAAKELRRRFNEWRRNLKQAQTWQYTEIIADDSGYKKSKISQLSSNYFSPSVSGILDRKMGFILGYLMKRGRYEIYVELWFDDKKDYYHIIGIIRETPQDWVRIKYEPNKLRELSRKLNLNILLGGSRFDYRWFDVRVKIKRKREQDAIRKIEEVKRKLFAIAQQCYRLKKIQTQKLNQIQQELSNNSN